MKRLALFMVLALAACSSGFRLKGVGTIQHLETTTPSSPCKDFDLSAVPAGKQKHAQEIIKILGDPALSETDRAELQACLCDYLGRLAR